MAGALGGVAAGGWPEPDPLKVPTRARRRCTIAGCPAIPEPGESRCPRHKRDAERRILIAKRSRRPYTATERARRASAVRQHVAAYGWVCPGWQRDEHPSFDLTADHITPVASGGPEDGPLQVLCRPCNSKRGAQP